MHFFHSLTETKLFVSIPSSIKSSMKCVGGGIVQKLKIHFAKSPRFFARRAILGIEFQLFESKLLTKSLIRILILFSFTN